MPSKNKLVVIAITAAVTLILADKLRSLPLVGSLPTVP
jgi:hypothetical protein